MSIYCRRDLLKLAGWSAAGLGVAALGGCEAGTHSLVSTSRSDAGAATADAETADQGAEPDMLWLDAAQGDAETLDASSPADGGAAFVIAEAFNVILNDPSCSKHSHAIRVVAASYEDDLPISYLGGSHEVLFRPSELMQLADGRKLPFATIGDGTSHGHCGTAWAQFVGPADMSLVDICQPIGTAACVF